jgi:hypothetical protein
MGRHCSNPAFLALLRANSLPLDAAADYCHVNRSTFWHWLRGRHCPRMEQRLSTLFGIGVHDLRIAVGLDRKPKGRAS